MQIENYLLDEILQLHANCTANPVRGTSVKFEEEAFYRKAFVLVPLLIKHYKETFMCTQFDQDLMPDFCKRLDAELIKNIVDREAVKKIYSEALEYHYSTIKGLREQLSRKEC